MLSRLGKPSARPRRPQKNSGLYNHKNFTTKMSKITSLGPVSSFLGWTLSLEGDWGLDIAFLDLDLPQTPTKMPKKARRHAWRIETPQTLPLGLFSSKNFDLLDGLRKSPAQMNERIPKTPNIYKNFKTPTTTKIKQGLKILTNIYTIYKLKLLPLISRLIICSPRSNKSFENF